MYLRQKYLQLKKSKAMYFINKNEIGPTKNADGLNQSANYEATQLIFYLRHFT